MHPYLIGAIGLAMEGLLLFRAIRGKSVAKFRLFWIYIACVFLVDVVRDISYLSSPASYPILYWATQFLSLLVGYGVILEIVQKSLAHYPGAERVARALVLAIFIIVFSYAMIKSGTEPHWSPGTTYGELERDLRAVQAMVFIGILGILFHYGIAIGRNLKGILLGYGLFLGVSVLTLALRSYAGKTLDPWWQPVLQYSYLASLVIWTVGLWRYYPEPVTQPTQFGADYEALALKTSGALSWVRSYLERTARP
jgi:hypothetical protein